MARPHIQTHTDYSLTRSEEYKLSKLALSGDTDARNKVVMSIYPLIFKEAIKIAEKYFKDPEDLSQIAVEHVIHSFHTYDPEKGYRPATYFKIAVIRVMLDSAMNRERVIVLPHNSHQDWRPNHVSYEQREKLFPKAFDYIQSHDADNDNERMNFYMLIPDETIPQPDEQLLREERTEAFYVQIEKLKTDDQNLVFMRLSGMTFCQIGDKFGVHHQTIIVRFRRIESELAITMKGLED